MDDGRRAAGAACGGFLPEGWSIDTFRFLARRQRTVSCLVAAEDLDAKRKLDALKLELQELRLFTLQLAAMVTFQVDQVDTQSAERWHRIDKRLEALGL